MRVVWSKHVVERMRTRGVLQEDVVQTILRPQKVTKQENKLLFTKNLGRGTLEVVARKSKKLLIIITTYRV